MYKQVSGENTWEGNKREKPERVGEGSDHHITVLGRQAEGRRTGRQKEGGRQQEGSSTLRTVQQSLGESLVKSHPSGQPSVFKLPTCIWLESACRKQIGASFIDMDWLALVNCFP